eukprot:sb/3466375/
MNLIHYKRVIFRTTEEEYDKIRPNIPYPDYLNQAVDLGTVPQRHLLSPEKAVKRCASELELDVMASDILNVLFIDVNCNPGLKAICDEERQRRHKTGIYTPQTKPATPIRGKASLPQTREWELKLQSIIQNQVVPDQDVMDFLIDLNATQFQCLNSSPSSNSSQPRHSSPASSKTPSMPSSQPKLREKLLRRRQLNLSIRPEEEEEAEEDEERVSLEMSQRVFYPSEEDRELPTSSGGLKQQTSTELVPSSQTGTTTSINVVRSTPPELVKSILIPDTPPSETAVVREPENPKPEKLYPDVQEPEHLESDPPTEKKGSTGSATQIHPTTYPRDTISEESEDE